MFLLSNVWYAGSGYMFEKEGFQAVATSSAGVAYALEYPDGEYISIDDLALCVKQMHLTLLLLHVKKKTYRRLSKRLKSVIEYLQVDSLIS